MAAYGALVSVMQIMDQIHRHPHPPISLDEKQSESLAANVTFLQEFLEGYNPHRSYSAESDPLESRIAEAAYAAEDVIESYIVDQILARSTDHAEEISSTEFYQGLQKVIEEMDLIKMEIEEKMKDKKKMGVQIIKKKSTISDAAGPFQSSSTAQKVTTMVGFDDVLYEMLDKITRGERVRKIIPIVGMGGLGKTTLAQNIYANPLIKEYFDIRAWSTISQVHNAQKILCEILGQVGQDSGGDLSEYDLGEKLYKYLIGRRYFIVMDDMWSIEAWDVVRRFFPENENGSRVVVTTRLSNLASKFNYSDGLDMKFLDDASCWNLFCKTAFGEEICPPELEKIGKKIVKGCRGLPLSIVVAGGLLSKSEATRENWELIEENLSSVVNSEGDGSCLQILYVSYNNLPVHLKPCFLYMGVFPEDVKISILNLVSVLVAEGIIKPFEGKSLEEVAEDCIQELVDRNLILVEKRDDCGKVKSLKTHDLLRDLALREGKKDTFLCVLMQSSDHWEISHGAISTQRRIATSFDDEYPLSALLESEKPTSSSLVRSLIGKFPETFSISNFRLLRVCIGDLEESSGEQYEENFIRLPNLRLIAVDVDEHPLPRIRSWAPFLWNLQTLVLSNVDEDCVLDIWKMPLLRHVIIKAETKFCLTDRSISCDDTDEVVLENLHTLSTMRNLNLGEEVIKRIPNIKKLKLDYDEELGDCRLHNLHRLHKLQELRLRIYDSSQVMQELTLPYSLNKLVLKDTKLSWEDMKTKIGPLPLLQVLKLKKHAFTGSQWETVEGQFSSLKFLLIEKCDLEHWTTDNTHFPRLEHLLLHRLIKLREIPSSIGDIPTLRSMRVVYCSDSAEESAQRIREEQEEHGNEVLQIQVKRQSFISRFGRVRAQPSLYSYTCFF